MNRIDGELYKNTSLDTINVNKDKTQKLSGVSNEETSNASIEENTQGYKLELSSVAKSLGSEDRPSLEDMKKKVEELKTKIANGTYEIDTDKIVQGLLKYF